MKKTTNKKRNKVTVKTGWTNHPNKSYVFSNKKNMKKFIEALELNSGCDPDYVFVSTFYHTTATSIEEM